MAPRRKKLRVDEVKDIMKHIMKNQDVLDMVLETMPQESSSFLGTKSKPSCSKIEARSEARCLIQDHTYAKKCDVDEKNTLVIEPSGDKSDESFLDESLCDESVHPLVIALPEDESLPSANNVGKKFTKDESSLWLNFVNEVHGPLKISDDELQKLVNDAYETDTKMSKEQEKSKELNTDVSGPSCSTETGFDKLILSEEQKLQLGKQMRQHVQILTQHYLLSISKEKFLAPMNESSKKNLNDLKDREVKLKYLGVYPENLDNALEIVYSYELLLEASIRSKNWIGLPMPIKRTIFDRYDVFLYPDLLPKVVFRSPHLYEDKLHIFTEAEDQLIAMHLAKQSTSSTFPDMELPGRTKDQIIRRIRNVMKRCNVDNPIKYYRVNGKLKPICKVLENSYDAAKVKAPKNMPEACLPLWMRRMIAKEKKPKRPKNVLILPKQHPTKFQWKRAVKYRPILPKMPMNEVLRGSRD